MTGEGGGSGRGRCNFGLAAPANKSEGGDNAEDAGALEGKCVRADLGANDAGDERGEPCAELMGCEDPAEDKRGPRRAEGVGGELHGWGHGGDPIEAIKNGEEQERGGLEARGGQVEERKTAQAVIDHQEDARVEAVGEPAGGDRADEVEAAHDGERSGGRGGGDQIVTTHRDEVHLHEAVGGGAANEEGAGEDPEDRLADGDGERLERGEEEVALLSGRRGDGTTGRGAEGAEADIVMERFDPEWALALIEQYRVTHSQWVPTMFVRMLKLPAEARARHDLSTHRLAIHAAAPCPRQVKRAMIEWWGPIVQEYYAGSEGNGLCAINSADWLAHEGSVGRPVFGMPHILDAEGRELPPGQEGTIYFSDGVEFVYHNDPAKTAESRNALGWTTLGDIGYLDAEGFLYLTDRKANVIISGGVNIYPQEAENLLVTHPKVMDVAVFGVPDEEFGEAVKAVVQPIDMGEAGPELEQELIDYCRDHLSHIKCPRSVDFEAELPRHPTGKLYKRLLRDRYWTGHESRIV